MEEWLFRKFGMDVYTLLYLKWITKKVLLSSTGNSAQYVAVWKGEEFGEGGWIPVYIWLSPFQSLGISVPCCIPETITTSLISYTPL